MIIYLIPDDYDPGNKFKLELDYSKIDFRDINHLNFIIHCIPESYLTIIICIKYTHTGQSRHQRRPAFGPVASDAERNFVPGSCIW